MQINKVIGENEKHVFYFVEKTYGLFGQLDTNEETEAKVKYLAQRHS